MYMRQPMSTRMVSVGAKPSKVVIVGAGPAGIHFAKKLKDVGYEASDITILEAQERFGGKSYTKFLPDQPTVRHEMGTCYMHLGYEPVRNLLEEYGLGDSEVGLGDKYLEREKRGKQRKVWDLKETGDYTRADLKGQDFDDWILSTADKKEMEGFYDNQDVTSEQRLTNIVTAAKESPQTFVKGLRVLRDGAGGSVEKRVLGSDAELTDAEVVAKLDRLQRALPTLLRAKYNAVKQARYTQGSGERDADFEDMPAKEIDGARFIIAGLNTVLQIGRYVDEHEKLFGEYAYGLPPKPSPEQLKELDCTFLEWLESKRLFALLPFFVYSQAAQGYGSLEKVPAIYGLWWNHPDYIARAIGLNDLTLFAADLIINGVFGITIPNFILGPLGWLGQNLLLPLVTRFSQGPAPQAVLQTGFSKLWENIVEQEELEIKLNCPVTSIDRSGATPVVTYKDQNSNEDVTVTDAKYVVLAVPLPPAMNGIKAYNGKPVVDEVTKKDPIFTPTKEEAAILGTLESYTLKTVLFKADPFPIPSAIYPGEVWAQALEKYGGRVRYLTNSELSTQGSETLDANGQTGYVAYQALDEPPNETNDKDLQAKFKQDVAAIGLTNVDVILEKPWYYFPHFPQSAVQDGAPWKLLDLQGKNGMFFAGSSCCFESVLDVMAYNDLIFEKFLLMEDADASSITLSSPREVSSLVQ